MEAFLASLSLITLAEMGDKTQLLAMSFACRYKSYQVLSGVFIAAFLISLLAVLAGRFLTTIVPMDIISLVAALSFILFGIWTLRGESDEKKESRNSKYGPIMTVTMAFFAAEMGDKTQLATISLAVKYGDLLPVLFGTAIGMVIADAIGIMIGVVMSKKIPEITMKWVSAIIFILFGFVGVYKSITVWFGLGINLFILTLLAIVTVYIVYLTQKNNRIDIIPEESKTCNTK